MDCKSDPGTGQDDGCETYLDQLAHCGTDCTTSVACPATEVCNGGACGAAQGLAVLTLPFTAAGQGHRFADKLSRVPDLTKSDVVVRAYAPGATSGMLAIYIQDKDYTSAAYVSTPLTTLSTGWLDITIPAGEASGDYDPSAINQITMEVSGGAGPWPTPTVIYLDSIRSTNAVLNDTFDASTGGLVNSTMMVLTNAGFSWAAAMPVPPS